MIFMQVELAGVRLEIPDGWKDITGSLQPSSPTTLAHPNGVGALQLSIAKYEGGTSPEVRLTDLRDLLIRFCRQHSLVTKETSLLEGSQTPCVGCVSITSEEIIAVWFLSDGRDLILATYTSLSPGDPATMKEIDEATQMVKSLGF